MAEPDSLQRPSSRQRLASSLARIGLVVLVSIGGLALCYACWEPGATVLDGRHDRGRNGMWLAHGWLGGDEWFARNGKQSQLGSYRSPEALRSLAEQCAANRITDLFPHLCPCSPDGSLPAMDDAQVERFLDGMLPACRVIPWIGGPSPDPARCADPQWRRAFCESIRRMFAAHPRFHGVHLNIEPMPSGDAAFLLLLEEIRRVLPAGKVLSVAAYPPPTRWHRFPDVHWEEAYFREVARRVDQLAVMMYDTSLTQRKLYEKLMSDWTVEVLAWAEGKQVLLGLPAYDDTGVGYHAPETENLANGLAGIQAGLLRAGMPDHYQGAAIYSHWEMDKAEWALWQERFLLKKR